MTTLRPTVNSFDMFDTLLARKCIEPYEIYLGVERRLNAPGFAAARRNAEFTLAAKNIAFDLYDIYSFLVAAGTLRRADADQLLATEIEAEFYNAIPIMENIRQVQEGDLVISDMYLPRDVLRRLLTHVGLRTHVHLLVTNLGKHFGTVWKDIGSAWIIARHTGDNMHSDIATPRLHGIPTRHYAGAQLSPFETLLSQQGYPQIARLMRTLRLGNPHETGTHEAELWNLACQLNLPLLLLFSQIVKAAGQKTGAHTILFSARDCYFLSEIFATLFPDVRSEYFYVSREVLTTAGNKARNYFRDRGLEQSLVCDISSTGSSWHSFAASHDIKVNLLTLVFIDDWKLARVPPAEVLASPNLSFSSVLRSSALKPYSTGIEVLNTAPHGTTIGITPIGGFHTPQMLQANELGDPLVQQLLRCHTSMLEVLRRDRVPVVRELGSSPSQPLVTQLVQAISQSPLLTFLGRKLLWPPSFGPTTP
jgi:hypothetical protein